jgi:hypothetical protein
MDFSKLAAICAAGLLLAPGRLAGEENILRFRVSDATDSTQSSDERGTVTKQPLVTARFASPLSSTAAHGQLDAIESERPSAPNIPDLHAMQQRTGCVGSDWTAARPYVENPWAGYAEEKWLAHARTNQWRSHSWLWWLDPQGGLLDLFGFFKRKRPSPGCCSASAGIAEAPVAAPDSNPVREPPRNRMPPENVLPRNQIPQSSSANRPAKSIAHMRTTKIGVVSGRRTKPAAQQAPSHLR